MDRQRLLDIAAEAIRADLLEPLGLKAPYIPINDGEGLSQIDFMLANGATHFHRVTQRPDSISVAAWVESDVKAAAILAHEMIHSALPYGEHHGDTFASFHHAIGLEGSPNASDPGPQFVEWFNRRIKPALA